MNTLLILIGWSLCVPAIIFKPIAYLFASEEDTTAPWVHGLLKNTMVAWRKYNTKSWIRRMKAIKENPAITKQYLKILSNKQEVRYFPRMRDAKVDELIPQHDVQTTHDHHRQRVEWFKRLVENGVTRGVMAHSDFGFIITVGNLIHDGHHRHAACKEAGVETVTVFDYRPTDSLKMSKDKVIGGVK